MGIFLALSSDRTVWFRSNPAVPLTMSLDTEQIHKLNRKGFDKLYSDNPEKFAEIAQTALNYAFTCVPVGEKVRRGDVVSIVTNAVKILPSFEAHLQKTKLTQNTRQTLFAEYVLERFSHSRTLYRNRLNLEELSMSEKQAAQAAAQYMKAQSEIMKKYGETPKMSGSTYNTAVRDTTRTFQTISAKVK